MPSAEITSKRQAAREVIDILSEISLLLNTHLDRSTLSLCVSLIENGVNPEALATVIRQLRKEGAKVQRQQREGNVGSPQRETVVGGVTGLLMTGERE